MNGITDPKDPYYIRPGLFRSTRRLAALQTKERICRYCDLSFTAEWRLGSGPQHCSETCIKAAGVKQSTDWRKAHPERFEAMKAKSLARKVKRPCIRTAPLKPFHLLSKWQKVRRLKKQ